VAIWPRLLLGEDWASGEPKVCPLLEGVLGRDVDPPGSAALARGWARARRDGPILDLIAPIRPLQLCADGGYQLRFRSLEGIPNYGPRHPGISTSTSGRSIQTNMVTPQRFLTNSIYTGVHTERQVQFGFCAFNRILRNYTIWAFLPLMPRCSKKHTDKIPNHNHLVCGQCMLLW
jgi:hypothetical protein